MVRVAGFTIPDEQRRIAMFGRALDQRDPARLTQRDAVTLRIERAAWFGGDELQRVEAKQHAIA